MGQTRSALAALDRVVERYGQDPCADVLEVVATALAEKGEILRRENRNAEARAAFDRVLAEYADIESPAMDGLLMRVLSNIEEMLGVSPRPAGGARSARNRGYGPWRSRGKRA